jgi:hypothetical protein
VFNNQEENVSKVSKVSIAMRQGSYRNGPTLCEFPLLLHKLDALGVNTSHGLPTKHEVRLPLFLRVVEPEHVDEGLFVAHFDVCEQDTVLASETGLGIRIDIIVRQLRDPLPERDKRDVQMPECSGLEQRLAQGFRLQVEVLSKRQ